MKQNIRVLIIFIILLAIVSAEIGELLAEPDDSQNLEQIIQRLDRLDQSSRSSNIIDIVIGTVLGSLVLLFFHRVWGYGKEIEALAKKVEGLSAEVKRLKLRINSVKKDVGDLWIFTGIIAIVVVICLLELLARHL